MTDKLNKVTCTLENWSQFDQTLRRDLSNVKQIATDKGIFEIVPKHPFGLSQFDYDNLAGDQKRNKYFFTGFLQKHIHNCFCYLLYINRKAIFSGFRHLWTSKSCKKFSIGVNCHILRDAIDKLLILATFPAKHWHLHLKDVVVKRKL